MTSGPASRRPSRPARPRPSRTSSPRRDGLRAERDELAKKLASVSDDIEAAKADAAASADRLSRLQADWENYRRRTERDRVTERERACEGP